MELEGRNQTGFLFNCVPTVPLFSLIKLILTCHPGFVNTDGKLFER